MKKVEIRKSKIDGFGTYATKDIKKGETIFVVKGYIHKFHPDDDDWNMQNAVGYSKNKWINPHPNNPLRYTNHSCNPNAILSENLKMLAIRDIKMGEEIFFHYSLSEVDPESEMGPCYCNHKNCKKEIKNIHHIPKKEFLKYKKYLPKWIIKEYEQQGLKNNKTTK